MPSEMPSALRLSCRRLRPTSAQLSAPASGAMSERASVMTALLMWCLRQTSLHMQAPAQLSALVLGPSSVYTLRPILIGPVSV